MHFSPTTCGSISTIRRRRLWPPNSSAARSRLMGRLTSRSREHLQIIRTFVSSTAAVAAMSRSILCPHTCRCVCELSLMPPIRKRIFQPLKRSRLKAADPEWWRRSTSGAALPRDACLLTQRAAVHCMPYCVCRNASPTAMAAASATFSDRNPLRIGMSKRASAAAWTSVGTPADSRPNKRMSSAR
jgi:hypothetical protein